MSQLFTQILILVPLFSPAPTVSGSSLVLSITSTSPHPIPAPNLHANATWVIRIQQVEETTGLASADIWPKHAGIYEQNLPKDWNKRNHLFSRNLHVKITTWPLGRWCRWWRSSEHWMGPPTWTNASTRENQNMDGFRKWGNYGKIWENMNLKKQQKGNLVPNSTRIWPSHLEEANVGGRLVAGDHQWGSPTAVTTNNPYM